MKTKKKLRDFYILWSTQSLSQLGSAMTEFALTLWLYEKTGSALRTSLLAICSYAPYIVMSIFAGALSDKWDKKKTMLVCDALAACTTVGVLILYRTDLLRPVHLYLLNAVSGLMNTVQEPASEVAMTQIIPKDAYQKTSGYMSASRSMISILNPLLATAVYTGLGMEAVVFFDLFSFAAAFLALLFLIRLPKIEKKGSEKVLTLAKEGLLYLKKTPLVFTMILFMAGVNFVASAFDAVLPAYVIPNPNGGEKILSLVTSASGIAMLLGSITVSMLPKPKNRLSVIFWTMLFSLTVENVILAFTRQPVFWIAGQFLGWFVVPVMSANEQVVMRSSVPVELQGRVYACRNTFQFFTIPLGLLFGGFMVDEICEPAMQKIASGGILSKLFGYGKGSGAAVMMLVLGVMGFVICMITGKELRKYSYSE